MYRLIDPPRYVAPEAYVQARDAMVRHLQAQPGLVALYQIGSVATPGISDIDLVAVFEDESACGADPRGGRSAAERYLFTHALFGSSRTLFRQAQRYTFFSNYHLLWGEDVKATAPTPAPSDVAPLQAQIALEYLVRLHATLTVQRCYGVLKVRSLLLHVKGVRFDLAFLRRSEGALPALTEEISAWRDRWFSRPPSAAEVAAGVDGFAAALEACLREEMAARRFHLAGAGPWRVARSVWLARGAALGARRDGLRLPPALGVLGRRYLSLQNRLNRFTFTLPVATDEAPAVLAARFGLLRQMAHYNRRHLPHFGVLAASLSRP